jgi:hypothetical protein
LPSNDKGLHRHKRDLISLLLFFQNKESRLKKYCVERGVYPLADSVNQLGYKSARSKKGFSEESDFRRGNNRQMDMIA